MFIEEMFDSDKKYIRVVTDGVNWYVAIPYFMPFEELKTKQTDVIGIDLGQKELAITSDGRHYCNITKDAKYKAIRKKLKKKQQKLSWLVLHSTKSYNIEDKKEQWKAADSIQFRRLKNQIRKLNIKLTNYKQNYFHNIAEEILKDNPRGLILETLNISGMMKNKKMAKALQQTAMSAFGTLLVWHATKHKIPVKRADMWFASTQNCSNCGTKNVEMKGYANLNKRIFICPICGHIEQRDENSALNLKQLYDKIPVIENSKEIYGDAKSISC